VPSCLLTGTAAALVAIRGANTGGRGRHWVVAGTAPGRAPNGVRPFWGRARDRTDGRPGSQLAVEVARVNRADREDGLSETWSRASGTVAIALAEAACVPGRPALGPPPGRVGRRGRPALVRARQQRTFETVIAGRRGAADRGDGLDGSAASAHVWPQRNRRLSRQDRLTMRQAGPVQQQSSDRPLGLSPIRPRRFLDTLGPGGRRAGSGAMCSAAAVPPSRGTRRTARVPTWRVLQAVGGQSQPCGGPPPSRRVAALYRPSTNRVGGVAPSHAGLRSRRTMGPVCARSIAGEEEFTPLLQVESARSAGYVRGDRPGGAFSAGDSCGNRLAMYGLRPVQTELRHGGTRHPLRITLCGMVPASTFADVLGRRQRRCSQRGPAGRRPGSSANRRPPANSAAAALDHNATISAIGAELGADVDVDEAHQPQLASAPRRRARMT